MRSKIYFRNLQAQFADWRVGKIGDKTFLVMAAVLTGIITSVLAVSLKVTPAGIGRPAAFIATSAASYAAFFLSRGRRVPSAADASAFHDPSLYVSLVPAAERLVEAAYSAAGTVAAGEGHAGRAGGGADTVRAVLARCWRAEV
jgi:hypothetical protein